METTATDAARSPRPRSATTRWSFIAFAAILALFGAALAVELVTLRRIAAAEGDVARLDHAKHAGHMVAAQVRDQYIHQAHTITESGTGHLAHYASVVRTTGPASASPRCPRTSARPAAASPPTPGSRRCRTATCSTSRAIARPVTT